MLIYACYSYFADNHRDVPVFLLEIYCIHFETKLVAPNFVILSLTTINCSSEVNPFMYNLKIFLLL